MGQQLHAEQHTIGVLGKLAKTTGPVTFVQNDSVDLFEVTGPVYVTSLFGIVSTAIANNACTLTLRLETVGLAAATTIQADGVGTIYSWVYTAYAELLSQQSVAGTEVPNVSSASVCERPQIVNSGTINGLLSNHDPSTGAANWYCTYLPVVDGGKVVALA